MSKKASLKRLLFMILLLLFLVAFLVWFFDPFYLYHRPFPGMDAMLNDRDNQMPGSVRNFSYDSVLVGSSVMENCDNTYLDARFGTHSIKVVRASGSMADLLYYLHMAEEDHTLQQVFWCLDPGALIATPEVTLRKGNDTPWYLHTRQVWDDAPYLFNKEILLERIPMEIAGSYMGKNTGGLAYNWAEGKPFGTASVLSVYDRPQTALPPQDFSTEQAYFTENIRQLLAEMESHPDCRYVFFLPPYSMCWWDCAYMNGVSERNLYVLEELFDALLPVENAELYFYQNEEEIIYNLDNYMDMMHYTPQINQWMLEQLCAGEGRVTQENAAETVQDMRRILEEITGERIYEYYERQGE